VKILPIDQVRMGMKLAQNIYRHDSLLAFPKGIVIHAFELQTLKQYNIDYVLVVDSYQHIGGKEDINFTLDIIESVYTQSTLWSPEFGKALYDKLEMRIIKNKRIMGYLNELRFFDSYSFAHCINISAIVALMLSIEGEVDEELADLTFVTLMHDIGRIKMPEIFNKEGKLNDKEFEELKKHPQYSFKLLRKAGFSEYELKFVLETHEKWDGTGYPLKIAGKDISDLAQLILLADYYNALSSFRPYRRAFLPFEVISMLEEEREKAIGKRYLDLFLQKFVPYRVGCMVELNNGSVAIVRKLHERVKTLPIIDIVSEQTGERITTVDLAYRQDLRIQKIIVTY